MSRFELPLELVSDILSRCSPFQRKALRLTCRLFDTAISSLPTISVSHYFQLLHEDKATEAAKSLHYLNNLKAYICIAHALQTFNPKHPGRHKKMGHQILCHIIQFESNTKKDLQDEWGPHFICGRHLRADMFDHIAPQVNNSYTAALAVLFAMKINHFSGLDYLISKHKALLTENVRHVISVYVSAMTPLWPKMIFSYLLYPHNLQYLSFYKEMESECRCCGLYKALENAIHNNHISLSDPNKQLFCWLFMTVNPKHFHFLVENAQLDPTALDFLAVRVCASLYLEIFESHDPEDEDCICFDSMELYESQLGLLLNDPRIANHPSFDANHFFKQAFDCGSIVTAEMFAAHSNFNPTVHNNEGLFMAVRYNNIELTRCFLKYPSLDPTAYDNAVLRRLAYDYYPFQGMSAIEILIKDPRVDPSFADDLLLKQWCVHKWMLEFLLQDPRANPCTNDYYIVKKLVKSPNCFHYLSLKHLAQDSRVDLSFNDNEMFRSLRTRLYCALDDHFKNIPKKAVSMKTVREFCKVHHGDVWNMILVFLRDPRVKEKLRRNFPVWNDRRIFER